MQFRKLMVITVISIGLTLCNVIHANEEMTLEEVSSRIVEVEQGIEECDKNLELAHSMAEMARQLGLPEDDSVILKAKGIYESNSNNKSLLVNEKQELYSTKVEIESRPKKIYLGTFKLTGYCPCSRCCGKSTGITATGAKATEGVTVAADWSVIPAGSRIEIEGVGERVVQDKGGGVKGNRIDIFVNSHGNAYNAAYNQKAAKVYLIIG